MFQFTVIQLIHTLGVRYAFSTEDDVWLFIQMHTCLCVKHKRTEGQQRKFDLMYILNREPEENNL